MNRKNISAFDKLNNSISVDLSEPNFVSPTRVADNQTLYDALREQGLLLESNSTVFGNLVRAGELGMCSDNGIPYFLAPGRHILWSPLNTYKGNVKISDKQIKLGNIEIVTIDKSEIGLSKSQGEHILLEPGQHILQAPQYFVESKRIDKNYVNLGTHHRISVPIGNVAVALNDGKKIIITPVPLKVDSEHAEYIICTHGKMFKTQSPTFKFDENTGFKSIQMEDIQLDQLIVNTSEMISLNVVGSVRYQITDPIKAFLITEDVVEDIKKQAMATLTSVFSQLSIDEIAPSIASTNTSNMKNKNEAIPHDMLHHATDIFMKEFQSIASMWGVDRAAINFTQLHLANETFRAVVQSRAQQSMVANTNLSVVVTNTEVQIQEAKREQQKKVINAEGDAIAIRTLADANLYAATKKTEAAEFLAKQPLAVELSLMEAQEKIAKSLGDKTVITDFKLGNYGVKGTSGQMLFLNKKQAAMKQEQQEEQQLQSMAGMGSP